jgi:hypothetical protein
MQAMAADDGDWLGADARRRTHRAARRRWLLARLYWPGSTACTVESKGFAHATEEADDRTVTKLAKKQGGHLERAHRYAPVHLLSAPWLAGIVGETNAAVGSCATS